MGVVLFPVIGVIVLLRKTAGHQEELDRSFERIRLLEDKVHMLERSTPVTPWESPLSQTETALEPAELSQVPVGSPVAALPHAATPSGIRKAISSFIHEGNLWAAGGILFLIAAFAMLIVYLARHGFFTVEMGIAAAAVTGLGMLVFGWRLRGRRPLYFLLLQGGGAGILYLAVFAAHKFTPYFPAPVSILLMSVLIPLVVFLALFQNSQPLVIFGFLGGFAAPLLLADTGGGHTFFFSYYLVLDLGVLAIGYFRPWQGLNLLAFLCTLGVSLFWVMSRYGPAAFWTTEPFIMAFIGVFTLLEIHLLGDKNTNQEERLHLNGSDILMILATPFGGALLQWRIFSYIPHGYAIISSIFSVLYLLLSLTILKRMGKALRPVAEGYLALALLLANLVMLLELPLHITSAVWAVEGVVVIFFSRRLRDSLGLNHLRVMATGFILHSAGAIAFVLERSPVNSGTRFTGSLIIALSAFIILVLINRFKKSPAQTPEGNLVNLELWLPQVSLILGIWAYTWWFGGWFFELPRFPGNEHLGSIYPWTAFFILCSVTSIGAFGMARYFQCQVFKIGVIPVLAFATLQPLGVLLKGLAVSRDFFIYNFFEPPNQWGWLLFFAVQPVLLVIQGREVAAKKPGAKLHGVWLFLAILITLGVLTSTLRAQTKLWNLAESWTSLAGILPVIASLVLLSRLSVSPLPLFGVSISLNASTLPLVYWKLLGCILPLLLCAIAGLWFLVMLFFAGNPSPLPVYLPVLSPLDIQQGLCIAAILRWLLRARMLPESRGRHMEKIALILGDLMIFLWIMAIIARSCHFYQGIPLSLVPASPEFHRCLFIFWALYGIAHIIGGHKRAQRPIWIAGAVLTVTDIGKLLIFDLADTGALPRIVSFFIAGLILLFIGWAAPLPPVLKAKPEHQEEEPDQSK
jgi:uncharacterized membrane protein